MRYFLHVYTIGQRDSAASEMQLFVDEKKLFDIKPAVELIIPLRPGYHTLSFRCGVRTKNVQMLFDCDYEIRATYNTLTGLIETNVVAMEGTEQGHSSEEISNMKVTKPDLTASENERGFEALMGEEVPDYMIKATSGLQEGTLYLYFDRMVFSLDGSLKDDTTNYSDMKSVNRKMGAIDVECAGNVHKVYSIPKDTYNEVMVFLTNKIQ